MPRQLTKKQREVIDLLLQGEDKIDCVLKVYQCKGKKPRASASVIANKLFKNNLFIQELTTRRQALRERTTEKETKFIDILLQYAPPREVAKVLATLIFATDKRVADSAIEKWLKLGALYPDVRAGIYRDMALAREAILSGPGDLKRLKESEEMVEAREGLITEELPLEEDLSVIEDKENPAGEKKE